MTGIVDGLLDGHGGAWRYLELGGRWMPTNRPGCLGLRLFYCIDVSRNAEHHVVVVVQGGISFGAGGGLPPLHNPRTVVITLWLLDAGRASSS